MSSRIARAHIVVPHIPTTTSATRDSAPTQPFWRVSVNSGRYNTVGGNLLVDANTAAVWIDNNTVAGALHVDNDSATTDVSGNSVGTNMECESNSTVTYIALNMVQGKNQGQCAASR